MVSLKSLLACFAALSFTGQGYALSIAGQHLSVQPYKRDAPLQSIVTWDKNSIFVRGRRILFYSGEFHPFRLPVPSLWLDIFQKLKAQGFSGVSFYSDWALLEGKQGNFSAEGVFDFKPFFAAAQEAGIYLIARPGPYINAEVSGGGYPGWLQRTKEVLRTNDYLKYTQNYIKEMGKIIADAQITKGGPVILVQPENEYSQSKNGVKFPDDSYFAANARMLRESGIVVPFISNDQKPQGFYAPGTGEGEVDIYGYDMYPLGFDCANPDRWPDDSLPTDLLEKHDKQSNSTLHSIVEFQGGAFDPWGGPGFDRCSVLLNAEFERVFYKNTFSAGVTLFSIYMAYGGTNWGNLGYALGYTSYDYGAAIKEDRTVSRDKYSEGKLLANFLQASPAYLTAAVPTYADAPEDDGFMSSVKAVTTFRLTTNSTAFIFTRQTQYNSKDTVEYQLSIPTTVGHVIVPQLGGKLSLQGRDSKISVVDYSLGQGPRLIYSSSDIFTWKEYDHKTVLVLYGGLGETHEFAIDAQEATLLEGDAVKIQTKDNYIMVNWQVTPNRKLVRVGNKLYVYLLCRQEAYQHWTLNLPGTGVDGNYSTGVNPSVIINGGYLLRTAKIDGAKLIITGDITEDTPLEILGAPSHVAKIIFNGEGLSTFINLTTGVLSADVKYIAPEVTLPNLGDLSWKYVDSLPELRGDYDDSAWTAATLESSNNPYNLTTPVSLYASDYGYSNGYLLYRGNFDATGHDKHFNITAQGGTAFGFSVWANGVFLGSYTGISIKENGMKSFDLPDYKRGDKVILTVLIDNNSLDEEFYVGANTMKSPRGILDYHLEGRPQSAITWKLTGNLGGEDYVDRARGPLNEGGLWAERQGLHLPKPANDDHAVRNPMVGLTDPGVGFFTTTFELDLPRNYDIPLSFTFDNSTSGEPQRYRSQLYVNGYQFGKYSNHIGPQTSFPVPEGILNYHGRNDIAISLWAMEENGAKIAKLSLDSTAVIQSGYGTVKLSPMPAYTPRSGAY